MNIKTDGDVNKSSDKVDAELVPALEFPDGVDAEGNEIEDDAEVLADVERKADIAERKAAMLKEKMVAAVASVRRLEPVNDRRKTALTVMDKLRDHILSSSRCILSDDELDLMILDSIFDTEF